MGSGAARVLVVGCGGIGGTVAAGLLNQGVEVTPLTRNGHIAAAINAHGFRTRGELSLGDVPGRAVTQLPEQGPRYDYVLLATQPPQVEGAARMYQTQVGPNARSCSGQPDDKPYRIRR